MFKSSVIPLILLLCILLIGSSQAKQELQHDVISLPLNKEISVNLPNKPNYFIGPRKFYRVILKAEVKPGRKYTLDIRYPQIDNVWLHISLWTGSPYNQRPSATLNTPTSSSSRNQCIKRCWNITQANFNISPKSNGDIVYITISSRHPNIPLKLRLRYPAVADATLRELRLLPGCSCNRQEKFRFGWIITSDLKLTESSEDSSILIEAEDELASYVKGLGTSWDSRELSDIPHSGRGYWYLSREGDKLLYIFRVKESGVYRLWIRDYNDGRFPEDFRTLEVYVDENKFNVPANTIGSGWGWHSFGEVRLDRGPHILIIRKKKTTKAAGLVDAIKIELIRAR